MSVWTIDQAVLKYGEDKFEWLAAHISRHFRRYEIVCRCGCGLDRLYPLQLWNLDQLRKTINKPLLITSGCRCLKQNAVVGGEINSMHLPDAQGMTHATDIALPKGMTCGEMEDAIEDIWSFGGIGKYPDQGFVHFDTGVGRENFRRWEG